MRLNHAHVRPGRGCVCGVVGLLLSALLSWRTVKKHEVSGSGLGWPVVEGESPVHENFVSVFNDSRVAAGP